MTRRFVAFAFLLTLFQGSFGAQLNLDKLGPAVGTRVPGFAGVDQFGRRQTFQSVLGPEGAMLVFFRSADW